MGNFPEIIKVGVQHFEPDFNNFYVLGLFR